MPRKYIDNIPFDEEQLPVRIFDASGVNRNPATSEKQDQIITALKGVKLAPEVLVLLQKLIKPTYWDNAQNRLRGTDIIESGTITTVQTLSDITSIDGYRAKNLILQNNRNAWASSVRGIIT